MTNLVFLEGVSGVGKSTMVQNLHRRLQSFGHTVRSFLEGNWTNPIDFYAAAYLTEDCYSALRQAYPEEAPQMRRNAIPVGTAMLVRYREGDRPLFSEKLVCALQEWEFCYNLPHPLPYADYAKTSDRLDRL